MNGRDATEQCRSERKGEDVTLKFSVLSSGCETRPVKAKPGRPVASLAARRVIDELMRRYASVRAVGYSQRKTHSGSPRVYVRLKAAAAAPIEGRGAAAAGEVFDHGTYEEDNPVTREAQMHPHGRDAADGESRDEILRRTRVGEGTRGFGKEEAFVPVEVPGQGEPEPGTDVRLGVGGL